MQSSIKDKLLGSGLTISLVAMLAAAPAHAQLIDEVVDDTTLTEVERLRLEDAIDDGDDEIVVTGSRIRRTDVTASFPTLVVGQTEFEDRAFTNIADALTEVPAFGGGIDPVGDQGANIGANFVDFLDLGYQRTLTVVNGRRFVSSDASGGSLGVDLNVFPTALIERVETIGIGGAPSYGSDAIAGTINVILRDDFEGLEATALYGQSERGDADRETYSLVAGASTADGRGNVTFSAEYNDTSGVLQSDRPELYFGEPFLSEVPPGAGGFNPVDVDGDGVDDAVFRLFNPEGDINNGTNVQLFTNGGVISPGSLFIPTFGLGGFGGQFFQFDQGGNLVDLPVGRGIPGTSAFFAQGGQRNDFFGSVDQLQSPVERINLASTARYDFNDYISFKGEFLFSNSKASELVEQGGFQTFAFGGTSGALQLPVSNPFLNDQARGVLDGLGFEDDDTFFLSRFNNDLLGGGARGAETTVFRVAGTLEGEFEAAGREFYWDVSGVFGQSNGETQTTLLNDIRFLNAIEAVRLTQDDVATIAANGNPIGQVGDIVCQVTRDFARGDVPLDEIRGVFTGSGVSNTDAVTDVTACEPLNLFGEGAGSAAAIDYVTQRGLVVNDIDQDVFSANLGGSLFALPAGDVGFVVGYEERNERGLFATGGAVEVGLGRGAATPDTGGSFSTNEYLGQILVPLVSDEMGIPFINSLEAEGQVREIRNSIAGNATVWTVGGTYQPIPDLTFKGNYTESVRAPSLTELFQPIVTSFQFADDPCDARFIGDGDNAANRAANCAAIGVPEGFVSNVVNATAQGRSGGNPDLNNERSEGFTLTAVAQPRFIPGLTFIADYIQINIDDRIGALTLEQNLETCFDADPSAFPNAACATFERDANFQVVDFSSGQLNADTAENQFLNFRADYRFDVLDAVNLFGNDRVGDYGEFGIVGNVFHVIQRDLVVANVQQDNTIGGFGDPRWSGVVDFNYNKDALRLFWRTQFQDRSLFSPSGNNFFFDENDEQITSLPGRFIHNASIAYNISEHLPSYDGDLIVQFNVDNVFDRNADVTRGNGLRRAFGDFGLSEALGRRYTMRVRATF